MWKRLKSKLLGWAVRQIFNVPDQRASFSVSVFSNGVANPTNIKLNGKVISEETARKYCQEARMIIATDLYRIMFETEINDLCSGIVHNSTTLEDLAVNKYALLREDLKDKKYRALAVVD